MSIKCIPWVMCTLTSKMKLSTSKQPSFEKITLIKMQQRLLKFAGPLKLGLRKEALLSPQCAFNVRCDRHQGECEELLCSCSVREL